MLKGFVSGVEKNITRIPMLVGNEYKEGWEVRDNQDRLIWGREDELQTTTGTLQFKGYGLPVKVKSLLGNAVQNGTPTPDAPIMPEFCGVKTGNLFDYSTITTGYRIVWATGAQYADSTGIISDYIKVDKGTQYRYSASVPASTAYFIGYDQNKEYLGVYNSVNGFVKASSNRCSNITIPSDSDCAYIKLMTFADNPLDNTSSLNTGSTALPYEPYGYKLPFTNAGQTTNVYLGQTPTVRRIKKSVLTGDENWNNNFGQSLFGVQDLLGKAPFIDGITAYSTHFKYNPIQSGLDKTMSSGEFALQKSTTVFNVYIKNTEFTSPANFKAWLAAQYAAGTPVTVWYVLAEPETAIVNEPLCKIVDYADELNNTVATLPEIPTTTGQNTLTVDTTLAPSSLTIKGHIKEWQPENLLPVSKFEDLSDPSWWSGGYYIRYNNMPAGTYVMSTNMPEKDPGDVYFNGENALNVPYEGRPVSITINEGDSFYVLFFVDRGGYESILNGTYTVTLIRS